MGWQDLLETDTERTLPWTGGRKVYWRDRTWDIQGRLPPEHGWYKFKTSGGRDATLVGRTQVDPDPDFEQGLKVVRGYLVGDRLISDQARVDPNPDKLIEQTIPVFLVEAGMDRFSRAVAVRIPQTNALCYIRQEFPQGPEMEVTAAYQDRLENLDHIQAVTPALDLAFRWLTTQRLKAEAWEKECRRLRDEAEKKRIAEEKMVEARKNMGTGAGRRAMAAHDFPAAARAALAVSGAELLDSRPAFNKGEMVVQYRFMTRRLECVCDMNLRIVDAGVCLTDHATGQKGDTLLTLESLPAVIQEALREGKLVVWRHVAGDPGGRGDWDQDDWED